MAIKFEIGYIVHYCILTSLRLLRQYYEPSIQYLADFKI